MTVTYTLSHAEIDLSREIGAERAKNKHARPNPIIDRAHTAAEIDMAGAAGEVGFCRWRGLDPYTAIDRRPVPDPGWDFELPAGGDLLGGRIQVRATMTRGRNLLHESWKPILWDYAVLVWCAPLPFVTVVGWCSRAEFLERATLIDTGALNFRMPWGLLHAAHGRDVTDAVTSGGGGAACTAT